MGLYDSVWVKCPKCAYLEQYTDFTPKKGESTGGRPGIDYLLTKLLGLSYKVKIGG
jgi:hypothetical protein